MSPAMEAGAQHRCMNNHTHAKVRAHKNDGTFNWYLGRPWSKATQMTKSGWRLSQTRLHKRALLRPFAFSTLAASDRQIVKEKVLDAMGAAMRDIMAKAGFELCETPVQKQQWQIIRDIVLIPSISQMRWAFGTPAPTHLR